MAGGDRWISETLSHTHDIHLHPFHQYIHKHHLAVERVDGVGLVQHGGQHQVFQDGQPPRVPCLVVGLEALWGVVGVCVFGMFVGDDVEGVNARGWRGCRLGGWGVGGLSQG